METIIIRYILSVTSFNIIVRLWDGQQNELKESWINNLHELLGHACISNCYLWYNNIIMYSIRFEVLSSEERIKILFIPRCSQLVYHYHTFCSFIPDTISKCKFSLRKKLGKLRKIFGFHKVNTTFREILKKF